MALLLLLTSGLLLFPGKGQLLAEQNGSPTPQPGAKLSRSDKTFLLHAAEENQAAIELAKVAEQKGFSATARNFARSLVAERSHAQQELVAAAHRVHLMLSVRLNRHDRKVKEELEKHAGAQLDRMFLTRMAVDLDRQYGSYEDTEMRTRNPAVRQYIENLLSAVKRQDQVAKAIAPVEATNSPSQQ